MVNVDWTAIKNKTLNKYPKTSDILYRNIYFVVFIFMLSFVLRLIDLLSIDEWFFFGPSKESPIVYKTNFFFLFFVFYFSSFFLFSYLYYTGLKQVSMKFLAICFLYSFPTHSTLSRRIIIIKKTTYTSIESRQWMWMLKKDWKNYI